MWCWTYVTNYLYLDWILFSNTAIHPQMLPLIYDYPYTLICFFLSASNFFEKSITIGVYYSHLRVRCQIKCRSEYGLAAWERKLGQQWYMRLINLAAANWSKLTNNICRGRLAALINVIEIDRCRFLYIIFTDVPVFNLMLLNPVMK